MDVKADRDPRRPHPERGRDAPGPRHRLGLRAGPVERRGSCSAWRSPSRAPSFCCGGSRRQNLREHARGPRRDRLADRRGPPHRDRAGGDPGARPRRRRGCDRPGGLLGALALALREARWPWSLLVLPRRGCASSLGAARRSRACARASSSRSRSWPWPLAIATVAAAFFGASMALGRVPGGHGGGAVAGQRAGGGRRLAPARRLRGAVLRVGGDALRAGIRAPRAAAAAGGARRRARRQAAGRARRRGAPRPLRPHRVWSWRSGLAQIGEFSFILGDLARQHGLMSATAQRAPRGLRLAVDLGQPLPVPRARRRGGRAPAAADSLATGWTPRPHGRAAAINGRVVARRSPGEETPLAVVVGYGPVGQAVDLVLRQAGLETVVVDLNLDTVAELAAQGRLAIYGDASQGEILKQAGIARASHLVVTLPHSVNRTPAGRRGPPARAPAAASWSGPATSGSARTSGRSEPTPPASTELEAAVALSAPRARRPRPGPGHDRARDRPGAPRDARSEEGPLAERA